ncbi:hypothetical protein CO101_02225 [Candidatus Berkelbacteria bacterium CG_4_9_14_3_um_filter_39_23]|uniref:HMA domain-containing protein n=1 Tax=Candidatus Berkelbacteria bacterium CG_4_9_14_3_um_filter_39_23 TaxID=1974508 RepID=A0A2M8C5C4_9BACT|nr:MAG: hypothetical protein COV39_01530 [Candidatus Berkelbacteria bacterium CG11_big_fil_rev_8_21_14_0_20_40_23]PJB51375.1 MAG: hypothetical protein CO101_02225 [Candidatus Berkelbacteria bacterium CG_4_9_14_3_um_filter_39_23]
MKEHIFYIRGMHCPSCEVLIEKKLLEIEGIKSADAQLALGQVAIEYEKEIPSTQLLNQLFRKHNYTFYHQPLTFDGDKTDPLKSQTLSIVILATIFIAIFILLNKFVFSGFGSVNSNSSLAVIWLFGALAGVSTCAALVGGIVLSMSKQWQSAHLSSDSFSKKLAPHLMFNFGRLISFAILGAVLGALGSQFNISIKFSSWLVILVSLVMLATGLQMLGVKIMQKFQITAPRFLIRFIADEKNFQGRWMPMALGALTFLLPCGFTLTAEGLALISGNSLSGALIMLAFSLGTFLSLIAIGVSSVKFLEQPRKAEIFLKVAGVLILFFVAFNINSQLNVLGVKSLSDIKLPSVKTKTIGIKSDQPAKDTKTENNNGDNGKNIQIIKMEASSRGYSPDSFTIKAGAPVRWEITDTGTSGCTNAVISPNLFKDVIQLTPGETAVKKFTPQNIGSYKFSCWMGMISGTIIVE